MEQLADEVMIDEFNATILALYRAPRRGAFWSMAVADFLTHREYRAFRDTAAGFAHGETRCIVEAWGKSHLGNDILVRDTVFFPTESRHDWGRVVHMVEDITVRMHAGITVLAPGSEGAEDDEAAGE